MKIIVTGGAGFIGSCVIRQLNDRGINDIIVVDNIANTEKWKNLRNKKYISYVNKNEFLNHLDEYEDVSAIIHLGACSSTTEIDFDYLWKNNFEYTKNLWEYSTNNNSQFIYASSAATYGDGKMGFDDNTDIDDLRPLNGYGYSKHFFDRWVVNQARNYPKQYVGLKFFNVYGPNEYCKGSMASMAYHGFNQIKTDGEIRLFKSECKEYKDGEQLRDFVYVKDVSDVVLWMLDHEEVNGLFNVGTGRAQSFKELAEAVFRAVNREPNIRYIDMPENIMDTYQYFTKAEISKLRDVGYSREFMDVSSGVRDYVYNHLNRGYEVY